MPVEATARSRRQGGRVPEQRRGGSGEEERQGAGREGAGSNGREANVTVRLDHSSHGVFEDAIDDAWRRKQAGEKLSVKEFFGYCGLALGLFLLLALFLSAIVLSVSRAEKPLRHSWNTAYGSDTAAKRDIAILVLSSLSPDGEEWRQAVRSSWLQFHALKKHLTVEARFLVPMDCAGESEECQAKVGRVREEEKRHRDILVADMPASLLTGCAWVEKALVGVKQVLVVQQDVFFRLDALIDELRQPFVRGRSKVDEKETEVIDGLVIPAISSEREVRGFCPVTVGEGGEGGIGDCGPDAFMLSGDVAQLLGRERDWLVVDGKNGEREDGEEEEEDAEAAIVSVGRWLQAKTVHKTHDPRFATDRLSCHESRWAQQQPSPASSLATFEAVRNDQPQCGAAQDSSS